MITKEFLENEIKTLEIQKEQHLAASNAAGGAVEAFKYLLTQFKDSLSVEDLENLTGMTYAGVENVKEKETKEIKSQKD